MRSSLQLIGVSFSPLATLPLLNALRRWRRSAGIIGIRFTPMSAGRHAPEEAKDLTKSFFARFLQKDSISSADRERGRSRTFLLTAMKHFLVNEFHRGSPNSAAEIRASFTAPVR